MGDIIPARGLLRGVTSPHTFELAKQKILHCLHYHEECRIVCKTPLPTRILDCSNPNFPKLVTDWEQKTGRYVALSYVWGTSFQAHVTTTDNIDEYHLDGIAFARLPQTLQDAVTVTSALGLRYL